MWRNSLSSCTSLFIMLDCSWLGSRSCCVCWGWGSPGQAGRRWAHSTPFFCNCSGSGGGHEPGALRLLTAGPDLWTMGTQLTVHIPSEPPAQSGTAGRLAQECGRKGSEGALQKSLREKALPGRGEEQCGGRGGQWEWDMPADLCQLTALSGARP